MSANLTPREKQKKATRKENEKILKRYDTLYNKEGLRGRKAVERIADEENISQSAVWYKIREARLSRKLKESKNAA